MEQHNSGDSVLELWDSDQGWIPFADAYLREATEYKLRFLGDEVKLSLQGVPVPFYKRDNGYYSTFMTPFQSGVLHVFINGVVFDTYVYTDDRKLTEEQFSQMLEEILTEANTCFQISGLETKVSASGRTRQIHWTQWSYIEQSFHQLRQIFSRIEKQPFRRLEKNPIMMRRERVQHSEQLTLRWLDRKGHGDDIPAKVQNVKTAESMNVYENQVLKQQLLDLYRLLRQYEAIEQEDVKKKAVKYNGVVQRWLNHPFLREIVANEGAYTITQKFRKHPVYRMWFQWFERLYKHKREGIGFDYPIALKDTFQLYEIWCYMKMIKMLRESGYVLDVKGLFRMTSGGMFLNLAENKESRIKLVGDVSLYYQRSYQYNSKIYHTYTQKMIPDIVLEGPNGIVVFDPKYRVPDNLGTALGEMHKYRDGILHRETGKRAVQAVYILTPTTEGKAEGLRYFQPNYQETYQMGAIQVVPGVDENSLAEKISEAWDLL